ncbi:sigma-70 family RNA polymerase sigma factor [Flavobacterium notoginsengisoli]|uniref:sigma-70 family RNA polymerase sigma factor n=1 Tax=Flavobacterium notoginsengisoli TaxID=1478199 RepID=UPI00362E5A4B
MTSDFNPDVINLLFLQPDIEFLKGTEKLNSGNSPRIKDDLKTVFDLYYEALVLYANRFVIVLDECEDLVQDLLIELWEKNPYFPDDISLKVFLYKSTRNKCLNAIKHSKVKDKYAAANSIAQLEDDSLFLEQILEEEIVRQLYQAIELLPDRKKEIIKLSLKGLKNQEISEILNIKLQTVKTLKSQSYTILRQQFQDLDTFLYFLLS